MNRPMYEDPPYEINDTLLSFSQIQTWYTTSFIFTVYSDMSPEVRELIILMDSSSTLPCLRYFNSLNLFFQYCLSKKNS